MAEERAFQIGKELSYKLDDAALALHGVHTTERINKEAREQTKTRPKSEQLILGTQQVNPLNVLSGNITAALREVALALNPELTRANSSSYVFVAKSCFLGSSHDYRTSHGASMADDTLLSQWGGIISGVSTLASTKVSDPSHSCPACSRSWRGSRTSSCPLGTSCRETSTSPTSMRWEN